MIKYYHRAETTGLIDSLLETWDSEVFSSHNKRKGHTADENAEVIDMDADPNGSEIAASLARLCLQNAARASTPISHAPEDSITDNIPDDFDADIYGDEPEGTPPSPASPGIGLASLPIIAAPAMLNLPATSNPDSGTLIIIL